MNTINIVLMIILSTMIGFAMGNLYGQAKVKAIFSKMIKDFQEGLTAMTEKMKKETEKVEEHDQ